MSEKIAHDFQNGYFLRDDKEIRESAPAAFAGMPTQAYSLFRKEPYGRVAVFAGDLSWAIEEALKAIKTDDPEQ